MDKESIKKRALRTLSCEIKALTALKHTIGPSLIKAVTLIHKRQGKIIVTGVGKSGYVGMKLASTLTSLGHLSVFLHPVEALHGDAGIVSDGDVVVALSFSGETQEVVKLVHYLQKCFSISVVAITGKKDSKLAQKSDVAITLSIESEGCPIGLAPMASTTATLALGDLIASALTAPSSSREKHFARNHPGGTLGLSLTIVKERMRRGREIPKVHEDKLFRYALFGMTKKKLGIVAVVNKKDKLVGVITDGDVRRILTKHDQPKLLPTKKVMTKNPKTILADENLKSALYIMEDHKVTSLFVVDRGKKLIGVIHMHDIIEGGIL